MARSSPELESTWTSQNTWSHFTSKPTTHAALPPHWPHGSSSCSNREGGPITPWLKRPVSSRTPLPTPKLSITTITTKGTSNWKSTNGQSSLRLSEKTTCCKGLSPAWKPGDSMNDSPTSRDGSTSTMNSQTATTDLDDPIHITTNRVDQEVPPEKRVMLPPQHVAKLLPWYHHWLNELPAKLHLKRLQREPTLTYPISLAPCTCDSEWHCKPHNACFIHDSCFCPGSSSFPSVKLPRAFLSLLPPF